MYKCRVFIRYFLLPIVPFLLHCAAFTCIHDDVTLLKPTVTYTRSAKYQDIKSERHKNISLFEPLQIHFYIDNVDPSVSPNVIHNVDAGLKKVKELIQKAFQVRKRRRPFRLERHACTQRWQSGVNRGECSKFKSEDEICAAKELTYKIPVRFLDTLDVYDFDSKTPRYSSPGGSGLLEENFVAFITSQSTSVCFGKDVFAYGTYCRLDPKTNEPLAGILNLCPNYFIKKVYPAHHYYNILLHELFHILGFSANLFEKYLPCVKGIYCNVPRNIIQEDSKGLGRMVYPEVIKSMQNHFSCSEPDFGAPMDVAQNKNDTDEIAYTSHWHAVLMYGSIMTPKFNENEHIFLDNITLAVFASTGWYRMNFTSADKYIFGKGEGCNFGENNTCENSKYLCNPSQNTSGCDLLHKTIGRCSTLVPYHPCGVFEPYTKEDCETQTEKEYNLDFYSLGYKEKCLMLQESDDAIMPYCLPIKCTSEATYSVLLNRTWYSCQYATEVNAEGGTLHCADSKLFCSGTTTPILRQFCPADSNFIIDIRMYFKLPTFTELVESNSFKNFKVATLRGITDRMKIPVNYIVNASLSVFKKIYLDFAICPPRSLSSEELVALVDKVQSFLDGGSFLHILKGPTDMIISSDDIKINPVSVITFSDHEGFRVLLAFPIICGIFLIVTFIASIVRLYIIQKHKPRRAVENQNVEDNQSPDASVPA